MRVRHPVNIADDQKATFGQRAADYLATLVGSWHFVLIQNALVVLWVAANVWLLTHPIYFQHRILFGAYDPFPFLLLNIVFSWQASNAAPILQMTQNRQAQKDRFTLEHDYAATQRVEAELRRNTALSVAIAKHLGLEVEE